MSDFMLNSPSDCEFSNFSDISDSDITATQLIEGNLVGLQSFNFSDTSVVEPQFSDISDDELVLASNVAEADCSANATGNRLFRNPVSSAAVADIRTEKFAKNNY